MGPPLWNVYFADASVAVQTTSFSEIVFADDLNAFRLYANTVDNQQLLADLRHCQFMLHAWGKANQVEFDPGKESFHVISRRHAYGPNMKKMCMLLL